jgi:acyl transferase domain-containing protein
MACRFPGANNYHEFWNNLRKGVNSIQEIPPDRWDIGKYYSPNIDDPNKSISKWCGLLDHIEHFDNRFFSISPREAKLFELISPLLLESKTKR